VSDVPESLSLVRCRDCASPLLQPVSVAGPLDERSLVTRYCPECERSDVVIADELAVQVWLRRDARTMTWMAAAADDLAAELALTESLSSIARRA
jgi:hypothetical protein